MAEGNIIAGLDIGSNNVRLALGKAFKNKNTQLIGVIERMSSGIYKGNITSIDDVVKSLLECLDQARRLTGMTIKEVVVGVSGFYIRSQISKGIVAVAKTNGEIQEDDVARALEAARMIATPANYEILHILPHVFTVDEQTNIKDPLGMTGLRLEVEAEVIQIPSIHVKNVNKCLQRAGLTILDLVFSPLAVSENILTARQKELGVALVNIGSVTTSLIVLEEGNVIHTVVIPIGSEHITCDIAIGLRVSVDIAERIKIEYGSCVSKDIHKKEEINLSLFGLDTEKISKRYVIEIIEARVEEILANIDKELRKINKSGALPSGIIFMGGGSKLSGLTEFAKSKLKLSSSINVNYLNPGILANSSLDISTTTAIGLMSWADYLLKLNKSDTTSIFDINIGESFKKLFNKLKS